MSATFYEEIATACPCPACRVQHTSRVQTGRIRFKCEHDVFWHSSPCLFGCNDATLTPEEAAYFERASSSRPPEGQT